MGKEERSILDRTRRLRIKTYGRQRGERIPPARDPLATTNANASVEQKSRTQRNPDAGSPGGDSPPAVRIPRSDYLVLIDLSKKHPLASPSPGMQLLDRELSRAAVIDDREVPPDLATLRSHVAFHDESTGRDWVVTIGHPADFLARQDAISVWSPLGAALIGLSEHQSIEFATADGRLRRVSLVRVLSQPSRFGRGRPEVLAP